MTLSSQSYSVLNFLLFHHRLIFNLLPPTLILSSSWEARLASMYSRAQQAAAPSSSSSSSSLSSSSSQPLWTSWSSSLQQLESYQAPSSVHSRVPHGGATVALTVPESSTPSLLTVSEFSAQLTFVSPGNRQTTAALWNFESGSVSYHKVEGEAAPVQRCGERQHRLLLKSKFNNNAESRDQSVQPAPHGAVTVEEEEKKHCYSFVISSSCL